MSRVALIAGATGLVGRSVLQLLLESKAYSEVISLQRRDTGISHPKLKIIQTDFSDLENIVIPHADDVFCCLGTTIKQAGSKEAFNKVDYEYPLALSRLGLHIHATHFLVITALGSDANSTIFYNKVKGNLEEKITQMPYVSISVLRPSLLLGERDEKRTGEKIGAFIANILNPVLIGPLKKYRGIQTTDVAKAMYFIALNPAKEHVHIYLSDRLQEIAANR